MYTLSTKGKTISIFPSLEVNIPIIYLNIFSDAGQKVYEATQAIECPPFTLVAISDLDWNHDMVPWDSPPAFKHAEPYTGGADDYLRLLTQEIIPTAEKEIAGVPCWRGIAGYSLAGLHVLLPGGQGEQDPEPDPAECPAEYGGDPGVLSGQGDRHGVSVEPWQPLRPRGGAHRRRHCLAAEPIVLAKQAAPRYNSSRKGGNHDGNYSMPILRQSRDDPGQPVGVRLVRRFRQHLLAPSLGKGQADGGCYAHRSGHRYGDRYL